MVMPRKTELEDLEVGVADHRVLRYLGGYLDRQGALADPPILDRIIVLAVG